VLSDCELRTIDIILFQLYQAPTTSQEFNLDNASLFQSDAQALNKEILMKCLFNKPLLTT